MSIGGLVALFVAVVCVIAMLIPTPAWLPFALIFTLCIGVVLSGWPLAWNRNAP